MTSQAATRVLIIALAACTGLTLVVTDFSKPQAFVVFIGVVGSLASILGILYTLYQLSQIREETALIRSASKETKDKIFALQNFGDVTSGIALIPEIQNYLRSRKLEVAIVKIQELKRILSDLLEKVKNQSSNDLLRSQMQNLNLLIGSFEKEVEERRTSIQISQVNGDLERVRDTLLELSSQMKRNT